MQYTIEQASDLGGVIRTARTYRNGAGTTRPAPRPTDD